MSIPGNIALLTVCEAASRDAGTSFQEIEFSLEATGTVYSKRVLVSGRGSLFIDLASDPACGDGPPPASFASALPARRVRGDPTDREMTCPEVAEHLPIARSSELRNGGSEWFFPDAQACYGLPMGSACSWPAGGL